MLQEMHKPGESPTLLSRGATEPAYELKFVVDPAVAERVQAWAARLLRSDPHAGPAGTYTTTTLALDTVGLDVFRKTEGYAGVKYRVRRYGGLPWVFLECKTKTGDRVSKQRSTLPIERLADMAQGRDADHEGAARFAAALRTGGLRPAALIAYERTAFFGDAAEGPVRLTIDRLTRAALCDLWCIDEPQGAAEIAPGRVIVELKYLGALPLIFKQMIGELGLAPTALSKYRAARRRLMELRAAGPEGVRIDA